MERAKNYYLDPDRGDDDKGDGTHVNPFRTIDGAIARIQQAFGPDYKCVIRHDSALLCIVPESAAPPGLDRAMLARAYSRYREVQAKRVSGGKH